jgi:hypothetical protein
MEALARMDLEDLSEEELEQLEATILGEPASPAGGADASRKAGSRPAPTTPTSSKTSKVGGGADANLPAWAQRPPAPKSPKTAAGSGTDLEALRLEGISRIDGKPVAIINGVRVFEGQSVGGARVVNIAEATVVLDRNGRRFTLSF